MDNDFAAQLKYLVDKDEIHQLLCRYCDALDFRRWEMLDDVFTPTIRAFWPTEEVIEGREENIAWIKRAFVYLGATHHLISNMVVNIDGDTASTECRVRAYHAGGDDRGLFEESLATFSAKACRTPAGWRINEFTETIAIMLGTEEVFAPPGKEEYLP